MRRTAVIALSIALIPVLLQILWQAANRELPVGDGGGHFTAAYLIYLNFSESFAQGMHFFFHSGGKPILFSVFAAPFVSLSEIDQLL